MTWEILSLSRLQKVLKWGNSLSRKHILTRKPRVWLDDLWLVPWKDQKRNQAHGALLKRGTCDPWVPPAFSVKGRIYVGFSGKTLVPWSESLWVHRRPTRYLRTFDQQKHCQVALKGTEKCKRLQDSQNSVGRPPSVKLLGCKHVLPFVQKEGCIQEKSLKPREQSPEPQRIVSKPWNLMVFAFLDFLISWDPQVPFFLLPFSSFLNRDVYNWYPIPVPTLYFGSR